MSIDILSMKKWDTNEHSIEIALPVFAVECEATPPIENHLDAYEDAVLKFVSIGISTRGIANALSATESLVEEILDSLERKKYAHKEPRQPWKLTDDGEKFLKGEITERESSSSQFGLMFINAIKKEVLPYFYQGNIDQIPLYNGKLPEKLTIAGDEERTFDVVKVPQRSLRDAYKKFFKILEISKQYEEGDLQQDEAIDMVEDIFEDVDSFDEAEDFDVITTVEIKKSSLKRNMFIRPLNCPYKKAYLTMRIIIDPKVPGGYKVESPFLEFNGVDNSIFLRQIQWLVASGNVFIGGKSLDLLLIDEIQKLCPNYEENEVDYSVFVLECMPQLKIHSTRFERIYNKMSQIYSLMQRADDLMSKDNVVSNISKFVVEALFNEFFRNISEEKRRAISEKAVDDIDYCGIGTFKKNLLNGTKLKAGNIYWDKWLTINAIKRLPYTKGNSIVEKYINLIVVNYYLGTESSRGFLMRDDAQYMYELADKLNLIRRKVSHDTDEAFTENDYEYYMDNVFALINALLEALKEN